MWRGKASARRVYFPIYVEEVILACHSCFYGVTRVTERGGGPRCLASRTCSETASELCSMPSCAASLSASSIADTSSLAGRRATPSR